MIERLVPSSVVTVEANGDLSTQLFPEEEASLGNAVEKRRREFVTGRACARQALARLGMPACAIPTGANGEPGWPAGVVGSITHCFGYRACAVAKATEIASIGIDAEEHKALPEGVFDEVSNEREQVQLSFDHADGMHLDRLLFSAKESVYKAWFPIAKEWLGFEDVELSISTTDNTFLAHFLVPGPIIDGKRLSRFRGRWLVESSVVVTATVIPKSDTEA